MVTLTLRSSSRGKLICPGYSTKPFDGTAHLNIDVYALPQSCVVDFDGKKESFAVRGTGMITCNPAGSGVSCDKKSVP